MKQLLFIILSCLWLATSAQELKPVTENDIYYDSIAQNAILNYEKYMPKCENVEDSIETLYYKAQLYWNIEMGKPNTYATNIAYKYYQQLCQLCRKVYGEESVQYLVSLSLMDWVDKTDYDYIPRNQEIGHLLSIVYPEKDKALHCLKYLSELYSIQMRECALNGRTKWYQEESIEMKHPLAFGFSNICKAIDPSCYPSDVRCNRAIPHVYNNYLKGIEERELDAYVLRYYTLTGCDKRLVPSHKILDIVLETIRKSYISDRTIEYVRPLLNVEISARTISEPTAFNICNNYNAALIWKGLLLETKKRKENTNDSTYIDFTTITWQRVHESLQKEDVAIEFVRLPEDVGATYYALTLHQGDKHPHLVPLCNESMLTEFRGQNAFDGDSVYNLIWTPLAKEIGDAKNIFFSADGLLHEIPIEYVMDKNKVCFADAKPERRIIRLSSTRELYLRHKSSAIKSATVYGGIKYATDVTSMKTNAELYAQSLPSLSRERRASTVISPERNINVLRDMSFGYLRNTLYEANSISTKCQGVGIQTSLYTGGEGSEPSFKALSGKKTDIIHIATHGFYIEEFAAKVGLSPLSDKYRSNLDRNGNIIDDPMLRSGLLFSGADNLLNDNKIPEGIDDGILYSKEVGELDLHNTDLVVLSACETAQGKIQSEGVYGLQRGFKQAGVGSMLMSLWTVHDEATFLLMLDFYHQLLNNHLSKYDALQHARHKLQMVEEYNDPKYWAAFILLDP